MTAAQLRAAIARDCPHRLPDYDRHLAGREPTAAFLVLWHVEWRISSSRWLEWRLDRLHRAAARSRTRRQAIRRLKKASQIRARVRTRAIKEMSND